MIITLWSVKGGSGTTVVAASLALLSDAPTLVVDLAGDLPDVLGCPPSDRPGAHEWVISDAAPDRLDALITRINPTLQLIAGPRGGPRADPSSPRWTHVAAWCLRWATSSSGRVVIDGGTGPPPVALTARASREWLVIRNCYLALRRAVSSERCPGEVILVEEPGRSLHERDVGASTGARVVAKVPYDPAIARAVDSGLLAARLPGSLKPIGEAA